MSTFKPDFYSGTDFGKALCAHYGLLASKVFDLKIDNANDDIFHASLSIMLGPDDLTSIAAHMRGDAPGKKEAFTVKVDAAEALGMLASMLDPGAVLLSPAALHELGKLDTIELSDIYDVGVVSSAMEGAEAGDHHVTKDTAGPEGSEVIHVEDAAEPAPIHYVYLTGQECSEEQRMWSVGVDDTDKVTRYAIPTDQLTEAQMIEHGARIRTL